METKFAIVLLHYNVLKDTVNLVESIVEKNEFKEESIEIIIVDNASPNKTGLELKAMFSNRPHITTILSENNLGFAKGNNIGYRFAVETFNPKFIILSNTDVKLLDIDMFSKIQMKYKETSFSVLGPDILNNFEGKMLLHQNPYFTKQKITVEFLNNEITRIKKLTLKRNFLYFIRKIPMLEKTLFFIKNKVKSEKENTHDLSTKNELEADDLVTLSGAFLIFSSKFIEKFPNGLNESTFMYGEEHFISYMCQKEKLKIIYSPDIIIEHMAGNSTASEKNNFEKNNFMKKETIKSFTKLIEYINSDKCKENT